MTFCSEWDSDGSCHQLDPSLKATQCSCAAATARAACREVLIELLSTVKSERAYAARAATTRGLLWRGFDVGYSLRGEDAVGVGEAEADDGEGGKVAGEADVALATSPCHARRRSSAAAMICERINRFWVEGGAVLSLVGCRHFDSQAVATVATPAAYSLRDSGVVSALLGLCPRSCAGSAASGRLRRGRRWRIGGELQQRMALTAARGLRTLPALARAVSGAFGAVTT